MPKVPTIRYVTQIPPNSYVPWNVIGVDEAGRGPWAGCVVAGAVRIVQYDALDPKILAEIRDSKALSAKARVRLAEVFYTWERAGYLYSHVASASVDEIDTLGIKQANHQAMRRALMGLYTKTDLHHSTILIDGKENINLGSVGDWCKTCTVQSMIKADDSVLSVQIAAILAKTARDATMETLHTTFDVYGFDMHKWYGTASHQKALDTYGVCSLHRASFAPIKRLILALREV